MKIITTTPLLLKLTFKIIVNYMESEGFMENMKEALRSSILSPKKTLYTQ